MNNTLETELGTTKSEEAIAYMEQRRNLRRVYEENVCPMINSGEYENVRNILKRNPEIKPFLEPVQWEKLYNFVNEQLDNLEGKIDLKIPWDMGDDE